MYNDVAYASGSPAQVLDIWLPEDARGSVPLVVFVHGGGFMEGDKAEVGAKVGPLLDAGLAVASVNYRLSGEAPFPAAPQDVKAAVRFLRANAETVNVDPGRFAVWGESAGGNLAALVGTTGDQTSVLDDANLGNSTVSSEVQAVVDWFGPTDVLQADRQASSNGGCDDPASYDSPTSPASAYLGAPIQSVPDVAAQANPITYIDNAERLPAFSIAHGEADCVVPFQQSIMLSDALRASGEDPELTLIPGAAHGGAEFDEMLLEPTIEWLRSVLG